MRGLFLLVALATPLLGAAGPAPPAAPSPSDPRVRELTYDPGRVHRVHGVLGAAVQIIFADDEVIEHVALGETQAWEAAPQGAVLFLRPLRLARPTNLILTTRKAGRQRHYAFDLSVRAGGLGREGPAADFQLRFRYPADDTARGKAELVAGAAAIAERLAGLRLDAAALLGPRNLDYALQGPASLAPSEATDNGRFTVLRFPGGQALPVVHLVEADGQERLAAYDVRGEFIVIHAVAGQIRLRRGREVVCIWNLAYVPTHGGAPSRTASPDVRRTEPPRPAP